MKFAASTIVAIAALQGIALAWAGGPAAARLWGFHAWTFLGPGALLACAVLAAVAAAGSSPRALRSLARVPRPVLALVLLALAYALCDRTHLLGDGSFWIAAAQGSPVYHAHEPLAFAAAWGVARGADALRIPTVAALELWGLLLAAAGAFLVLAVAARAGRSRDERFLVGAMLLSGGLAQLGAGYIEAYPALAAAFLAVLLAALGSMARPRDGAALGLAFGCAAGVHILGWLLLPAVAFRLAGAYRRNPPGWLLAAASAAPPLLLAYAILPRFMLTAAGADASVETAAGGILELASALRPYPHGIDAWMLDHANRLMLLLPLGLAMAPAALAMRGVREDAAAPFLALACLPFALSFVLDTEGSRGSAFDWDGFAAAAIPAGILIARGASPVLGSRWGRFAAACALGVAVFSTAAFVLVNTSPEAARPRLALLAERTVRTDRARALAWESQAIFHRERGDAAEAAADYMRAARHDANNARLWRNAAGSFALAGDPAGAAEAYRGLLAMHPGDPDTWFRYALTLEELGENDRARDAYRRALTRKPGHIPSLNKLAESLLRGAVDDAEAREAYDLLRRSLREAPDQEFAPALRAALERLAPRIDAYETER